MGSFRMHFGKSRAKDPTERLLGIPSERYRRLASQAKQGDPGVRALDALIREERPSYHEHNAYAGRMTQLFRKYALNGQSALMEMRVCPKCERYCPPEGPEHARCEQCGRVPTTMTVERYLRDVLKIPKELIDRSLAGLI